MKQNELHRLDFKLVKRLQKTLLTSLLIALSFLAGCSDSGKTPQTGIAKDNYQPDQMAQAQVKTITEWHEAVGTVRPLTENSIQARVTGQVLEVKVNPGAKVEKGMLLLSLDNRQLLSRLDQAKQSKKAAEAVKKQALQSVAAAQAAFNQAQSSFNRVKEYFDSQAATADDLEKAQSRHLQAKAELSKAKEGLRGAEAGIRQAHEFAQEAEISLGYTKITAPESGEILQRLVDPGDLALPGKPLLILRTSGKLRLEAFVREGLIKSIQTGQLLKVNIDTLDQTVDARVEEIMPFADPKTRTFLVKVNLPAMNGLYPGMFGKLLIPGPGTDIVLVPAQAIRKVGQLEMIMVKQEKWQKRMVKSGKTIKGMVEILSGLSGTETIGWEASENAK